MAEVNLSGVFANVSSFTAILTVTDSPKVDLSASLSGSGSLTSTGLDMIPAGYVELTGTLSGTSYLYGRLSSEVEIHDAFIDLTHRAPLSYLRLPSVINPTVIVSRSPMCWLGPPLVEYHDDRSSSVVTFPSVGTNWTVVSGGTVLAVNGVQVRQSAEDEIFDGVYEP